MVLGIYESDVSRLSELNLQLKLKKTKGMMRRSLTSSTLRADLLDANVRQDPGSRFDTKAQPCVHPVGAVTIFDTEVQPSDVKVHDPGSKIDVNVQGPVTRSDVKIHPEQGPR